MKNSSFHHNSPQKLMLQSILSLLSKATHPNHIHKVTAHSNILHGEEVDKFAN